MATFAFATTWATSKARPRYPYRTTAASTSRSLALGKQRLAPRPRGTGVISVACAPVSPGPVGRGLHSSTFKLNLSRI